MTTIISFVLVLGILILVHEFGHFIVARMSGVGVERFSIGFGPVLLRYRGKETEYCLSLVPLGFLLAAGGLGTCKVTPTPALPWKVRHRAKTPTG